MPCPMSPPCRATFWYSITALYRNPQFRTSAEPSTKNTVTFHRGEPTLPCPAKEGHPHGVAASGPGRSAGGMGIVGFCCVPPPPQICIAHFGGMRPKNKDWTGHDEMNLRKSRRAGFFGPDVDQPSPPYCNLRRHLLSLGLVAPTYPVSTWINHRKA